MCEDNANCKLTTTLSIWLFAGCQVLSRNVWTHDRDAGAAITRFNLENNCEQHVIQGQKTTQAAVLKVRQAQSTNIGR